MNYEVKTGGSGWPEALPPDERRPYVKRMGFFSTRPADSHKDALICANGRIHMLVYGQPEEDTAVFSEETLYTPKWEKPPEPPKIAKALPEVRRMLKNGDYWTVPSYVIDQVVKDPVYDKMMPNSPDGRTRYSIKPASKHIAFIMKLTGLTNPVGGTKDSRDCLKKAPVTGLSREAGSSPVRIRGYLRSMNLEKGEAYIRFEDEEGVHERRNFVSRADNAAVQEFVFPTKRKEISLRLLHEKLKGLHEWDGLGFCENLTITQKLSDGVLLFEGRYPENTGHPEAGFLGAIRVVTDGKVSFSDGVLTVRNCGKVMFVSSIRRFETLKERCPEDMKGKLLSLSADYDHLMERHEKLHGELMRRAEIVLADENELLWSVEELLEAQHCREGVSRALLEKMYHMGRYFLITETGTLPPARGQYNINVNLQVCSGNLAALPEMMQVFFRFFESRFADFRVNAENIFGCRGIMANIHPDIESGYQFHFSGPWPHEYWISCAGWVFHEFWDYYLTTGDEEFLREHVLPGLKEIALFYEDYLSDRDENGRFLFYPCFSPENGQAKGYPITVNAVMDINVCCEVLENLVRACEILGISEEEAENIEKWKSMLASMPALLLDEAGGLKEWAREDIPENYEHRHVSHHYGVWPAHQITWEKAPELAKAVLISNRTRGQENDSAHGIMHRMFTAIRLKDAQGAMGYFKQILERGFTNYSLMTNHFPHKAYYPDALGGMPAAITECAVFSEEGRIEFLPAAFGAMKKGTLIGAKLFTRTALDRFEWDEEAGYLKAELMPLADQTLTISTRMGAKAARVNGRDTILKNGRLELAVVKGEKIGIEMFF